MTHNALTPTEDRAKRFVALVEEFTQESVGERLVEIRNRLLDIVEQAFEKDFTARTHVWTKESQERVRLVIAKTRLGTFELQV